MIGSALLATSASGAPTVTADSAVTSEFPEPGENHWWGNVPTRVQIEVNQAGEVSHCEVVEPDFMREHAQRACARISPTPAFVAKIRESGKASSTDQGVVELRVRATIPSATYDAQEMLAAADFRIYRSEAVKCVIHNRQYLDPDKNPVIAIRPIDRYNAIRKRSLVDSYIAAYDRIIVGDARYPFRDICSTDPAAPTNPAELLRYLAKYPALDDGTLPGAVRSGDLRLVLARAKGQPELVARRDSQFKMTPLDWAIYKNRKDIAEALLQFAPAIPEATKNYSAWTESPLISVIDSGNLNLLDWTLAEIRLNPERFRSYGYELSLTGLEREVGYDATRKIASYFLDLPTTDVADQLFPWLRGELSDTQPVQIVRYVLGHQRVYRECHDEAGGWNRNCGDYLEMLITSGAVATVKMAVDTFQPTPRQMSDVILHAIRINADRPLPILLSRAFDREVLRKGLAFNPVGKRVAPTPITQIILPEFMQDFPPVSEKLRLEREKQTRDKKAADDAAKASAERNIINLLLGAGYTRQEIIGRASS